MNTPFEIFSASAGTGKTYRLTRNFIGLLLRSRDPLFFRHILAITFTNKAVEEMKERVIKKLHLFSREGGEKDSMFRELLESTGLSEQALKQRSHTLLRSILHNYAYLDIVTIDRFNHRLIQTFAHDLRLPPSFEVELDDAELLETAVLRVIDRSSSESDLRKALIDYVSTRLEEDRSWSISETLKAFGKRVFSEVDLPYMKRLGVLGKLDLPELKRQLGKNRQHFRKLREERVREVLRLIEQAGYPDSDYNQRFLSFIKKMGGDDLKPENFTTKRDETLPLGEEIFKKNKPACDTDLPLRIGSLYPEIRDAFFAEVFHQQAIRSLYPTLLLIELYREVSELYQERQLIHISEFNRRISEQVRNQPAPYIYERLGERYQFYFIDEFQDTSTLQWENLVPLIDYSLSNPGESEEGSGLFLVGDVKQSIYRWRGGDVFQFMGLMEQKEAETPNTFAYPPRVSELDTNFRSGKELVRFVNRFFNYALDSGAHPRLNKLFAPGLGIRAHREETGYVRVDAIDPCEFVEDKPRLYAAKMATTLAELRRRGYRFSDVGILVRSNRNIENLTLELKLLGIPVTSERGQKLQDYPAVRLFLHLLQYAVNPEHTLAAGEALLTICSEARDPHQALSSALEDPIGYLQQEHDFDLMASLDRGLTVFAQKVVRLIPANMAEPEAIVALMNQLREYEKKPGNTPLGFIELWNRKKEEWYVQSTGEEEAVRILTIHKSKGLQYPVVFLPFEESSNHGKPAAWLPTPGIEPVDALLFRLNKDHRRISASAAHYLDSEDLAEQVDHFNVWYVALTRAESEVYIWLSGSGDKAPSAGKEGTLSLPGILYGFARDEGMEIGSGRVAEWGQPGIATAGDQSAGRTLSVGTKLDYELPRPLDQASSDPDGETDKEQGRQQREWGNLVHELLARIRDPEDLRRLQNESRPGDGTPPELWESLNRVVHHPELSPFFAKENTIRCEMEILMADGGILRPDRVYLDGNRVSILDYKTGSPQAGHEEQIRAYRKALEELGLEVQRSLLVYMDEAVVLKEVS